MAGTTRLVLDFLHARKVSLMNLLFSSENVRSIYSKSGNENDYNISYKIVDENNNTLLDLKREFKVVDDSTTFSTLNNKEYTNKFSLCFIATDKKLLTELLQVI